VTCVYAPPLQVISAELTQERRLMLIAVDNVRSWHLADIDSEEEHVRYWRENGHPRIRYQRSANDPKQP